MRNLTSIQVTKEQKEVLDKAWFVFRKQHYMGRGRFLEALCAYYLLKIDSDIIEELEATNGQN